MSISDAINEYKKNIIESEELNESLFTKKNKEEWIKALHNRAKRLTLLYDRDSTLLDYVEKEINRVDGKEMDDAFNALYDLYLDGFDDAPLMILVLKRMEEYYSKAKDYEKMIVSYSIHAYESHEYISRLDPTVPLNIDLYQAILDLKDHYKEIERPRVRWNFFVAYFNIIVASEFLTGVSPDRVYQYLLDAEALFESSDVQELDKDNQEIVDTIEEIRQGFLVYSERYPILSKKIQDAIYERALVYKKDNIYDIPKMPYLAINRCLYERGEIDKEELLKRYYDYFLPKINTYFDSELNDDRITKAFEVIGTMLKCLSLEGEANVEFYFGVIKKFFRDIEEKTKVTRMTPYINTVIADYVINALPFEHDKEEIEQTLFDNLIRRQAPTYIHSVMVMKIADLIYKYMDKSLLPKMDNIEEFIQNSALLHDIGKSMITDIVNMQRRRLSDSEFLGIKNHPTFGIDIIKKNDLLYEYHDIIIGHHKWYNGLGGYPSDFDNTKSKYKIIIDLITIADCIDAATDSFGRNYKRPKSLLDVLEEFKASSGIKYSPYFINLIDQNEELKKELEELTQYKRADYMYRAYIKGKIGE